MNKQLQGFIDFIREQGVIGLAVGFILGGAVSNLVKAFIDDLINPILGLILGAAGSLESATIKIGPMVFKYGNFHSVLINFVVIAAVVYYGIKGLGLDKLDKKKEEKK